jgi:hypothetical protein
VLVAHACNPSYAGGSDQEDCSLKPAWANKKFTRPLLEKIRHKKEKRAGRVAQGVGLELKPQYRHKKKKKSFFEGIYYLKNFYFILFFVVLGIKPRAIFMLS